MNVRRLWIIGAGGHAKVVVDTCRAAGIVPERALDDRINLAGQHILGVPVTAPIPSLDAWQDAGADGFIAIGSNRARQALASRIRGVRWSTVVHPSSLVSRSAHISEGAFVAARAVVQPDARVGYHTIINTGVIVEHDCVIGDYAHLAPGSILTGSVIVGSGVLIGAGCVVVPGITIGDGAVCGAGSVVIADVPPGAVVKGIPARQ